ncbi:uncharacterized protein SETTUDRAFT_89228 [Exserohilum turcica Et28A]|uniref:Kinetochore protein Mis13 n=1 Tax=Exserohilum turcicum (strain 28A) TaxID=671987 RepID=R0KCU9_EXST2|nr:uncharacterized protein SETTUDRAFT_89228 [Exserohilum turcica Et28A]EOA87179.1 hypothetical protein SETTUDRAFT_89228 [Exserohilum turcica Et28A]
MATNRPTTRRRSAKQAFDDDDAPPVQKRPRTEVNGTTKKAASAPKRTAKAAAYDEDDDGFQFSRRTSRRTTKAPPAPEPAPVPVEKPAKLARIADAQPTASTSRRKKQSIAALDPESSDSGKRRRSARISGDREQLEVRPKIKEPPLPATKSRTKKTAPPEKEKKKQTTPAPEAQPKEDAYTGVRTPTHNKLHAEKKSDPNAQRITLPFADTPVIARNKEMRKGNKDGHRRSSTGLRGRRASFLIDSGQSNALPHSEVEVREFYKYIEQSLPEPRRMRQLLTWCGSRALPPKPSGDVKNANAIMAARAIQQELLDDFAGKSDLSDWYSRTETALPPVVKKPNPQNEKNKATLQELEAEIKLLEEEKDAWAAIASTSKAMPPPTAPSIPTSPPSLSDIDISLLDPDQAAIVSTLQSSQPQTDTVPPSSAFTFRSPATLQTHLEMLASSLEPHIDVFADGVHKIEQYRQTAERVADRVLGTAAKRLEERDREAKERVGTQGIGVGDILRGLAGVLGDE